MSWAWLCWVSQIIWARRARVTSAVSALRDLRKAVSNITRRPGASQYVTLVCWRSSWNRSSLTFPPRCRVGLGEVLSVLGEQADEEVDPAEVAVGQAGQPGPDFRLISTSYKPAILAWSRSN